MARHVPAAGRPVPTATYRLQLRASFGFRAAAAVVDHLAALGVSHVYCSPVLAAVPGSAHGYDVVAHDRLSPELGGDEGWRALVAAAREAGLGIVVDVVPNHMAVPEPESLNAQLWDVLKRGRDSAYAGWFDIDWDAQDGRILMPVLGQPLTDCLASGELVVDGDVVRYHGHVFPVADGTSGRPTAELLAAQHYRLAWWRVGLEELNYRRFFDITTLAGLRIEDPDVYAATHARILQLLANGDIDGLRVDHPDGLADPERYLARLTADSGGSWVVAEKILDADERLPEGWPCAGTTGYDALNRVMWLLTDPAGERPLTDLYASLTAADTDYRGVAEASKRHVVDRVLGAEVERLTDLLVAVGREGPTGVDTTRRWLREALTEVLAAFDVYRAYVPADTTTPASPPARTQLADACARARARRPDRARDIDLVERVALLEGSPSRAAVEFATRFQQTTGPVMAKGVEDTAFYRYARLSALNEVGGDPARFGAPVSAFHEWCGRVVAEWPATMTTLSTHDTKRSEDVRARLLVLSEITVAWGEAVTSWRARRRFRDPNLEYLFWQSLVGAWPLSRQRASAYLEKAAREAKQHTSWTDPDAAYDAAVHRFVDDVYRDAGLVAEIGQWVETHLVVPGRVNALSQKVVQLTMPGVPDLYQGCELWSLALVDPDNRRDVDYDRARALLATTDSGLPPLGDDADGAAKLLVTSRCLQNRRAQPQWYGVDAGYAPISATGPAAGHLIGFVRGDGAATFATRLPVGLSRIGWDETEALLPDGEWEDAFTGRRHVGGTVAVADVLERLPVALLLRRGKADVT